MTGDAGERLVFDHVYKTGGWAASEALAKALPPGTVSPHVHPKERPVPDAEITKWRHICGHFGLRFRHLVPHFATSLTATVVRDPAACVVSTYTYWRFNIPRDYAPKVARAHDLGFAEFVRGFGPGSSFVNGQSDFLAGPPTGDPEAFARAALAPYTIVGVTADLAGFVARVLARIAPEAAPLAGALLAAGENNASRGSITPTAEDLAYLAEHQVYDRPLYAEALRRADAADAGE